MKGPVLAVQIGQEGADGRGHVVAATSGSAALVRYGASLLACAVAGGLGAVLTRPKIPTFYAGLVKPDFTPPNWAFPVAWTVLYCLMAIAAGRIACHPAPAEVKRPALVLFAVQLVLGVVWSWTFFGQENPPAALLVLVVLLAAVAATAVLFARIDRPAGGLLVPLLAWVAYAGALNAAVVSLN